MNELLTKKEIAIEKKLRNVVNNIQVKSFKENLANGTSFDICQQQNVAEAKNEIAKDSFILTHRYQGCIKTMFAMQQDRHLQQKMGKIVATKRPAEDMIENYRKCFDAFVDSEDCVSFKVANKSSIGNLTPKDAFILTFFSMLTNYRQANDQMLQLICCGTTSTGKTSLFEMPLQSIGKQLATDEGVGRYVMDNATTLMIHDCDISMLYSGKDFDKIKGITRTEPVAVKIQGKVYTVPPVFVFVTSNKHLMTHNFATVERTGNLFRKIYTHDILTSNKRVEAEDLAASQARFIELFVRQRPIMPEGALPDKEQFTREHAIFALYDRILYTLEKYEREDSVSPYYNLYPLSGLCKNIRNSEASLLKETEMRILNIIEKMQVHNEEKLQLLHDFLPS